MSYARYAIIDHIVYDLNLDDLTATVLNFQTDTEVPCDVKIPEYVLYKNDMYKVTGLKHNPFINSTYCSYDYKYSSYKYWEARENIEHLELPNTLIDIEKGAFNGMRRLKALIIPASVKTFTYVAFWDLLSGCSCGTYPRLETIIIQGTPICERGIDIRTYKEVSVGAQIATGEFDYIKMMAYIVARVDSITNKSELCPNLKLFSMPKAKEALEAAMKNKSVCSSYNLKLKALCVEYNAKLKEHAFYDGTILTYEKVRLSDDIKVMKLAYNQEKENLSKDYNALVESKMQKNLRENNKEKYVECYKIAHPDKKAYIDSVLLEFRCKYDYDDYIIDAIEGKSISITSCREGYYKEYAYLFKDRLEYDSRYDMAVSNKTFMNEIEDRKNAKQRLKMLTWKLEKYYSSVKLQKIYSYGSSFYEEINYYKTGYYYDEAINAILSLNDKAKVEYEKNGQYFANQEEFFEAYLSSEYKNILKNKKKAR